MPDFVVLLSVPGLHDPVALALERVREELLNRLLVVDQEHREPPFHRCAKG